MLSDPAWFNAIIPPEMAGGRDMNATADYLRSTLYDRPKEGGLEDKVLDDLVAKLSPKDRLAAEKAAHDWRERAAAGILSQ